METFLYEMHLHTSGVSRCANVAVDRVCEEYKKAGYDGIVVTNHLNPYSIGCISDDGLFLPEVYAEEFHRAKSHQTPDFTVLLGMEINLSENCNDYLLYGLTEEHLLKDIPADIMRYPLSGLRELTEQLGILLFQAHPFRNYMTVMPPSLLDGVEIHNGNPRHDSRNFAAARWAEKHGLLTSSGSDYHELCDIGRGGVRFDARISDEKQLADALRSGGYTCFTGEDA